MGYYDSTPSTYYDYSDYSSIWEKDDMNEKYAREQEKWLKENDVKIGDYLKVTRKCSSFQNGWNARWVDPMNSCIGNIYQIEAFRRSSGIRLKTVDKIGRGNYVFPYFVLEKPDDLIIEEHD